MSYRVVFVQTIPVNTNFGFVFSQIGQYMNQSLILHLHMIIIRFVHFSSPGSPLSPLPPSRPSRPGIPLCPGLPGIPGCPHTQPGFFPEISCSAAWTTTTRRRRKKRRAKDMICTPVYVQFIIKISNFFAVLSGLGAENVPRTWESGHAAVTQVTYLNYICYASPTPSFAYKWFR